MFVVKVCSLDYKIIYSDNTIPWKNESVSVQFGDINFYSMYVYITLLLYMHVFATMGYTS